MKPYIPIPKPTRPSEPSPLDMAIYNYECQCADFHNNRNSNAPSNESPAAQRERIEKRHRDMEHLKLERRKIAAHIIQQQHLAAYRAENLEKDEFELLDEAHHPTEKLAKYLAASGEPKPTTFHEAHHIVPGKGSHKQAKIIDVRLILHSHGIGINDPYNGVWLANFIRNKKDDWATPPAPTHRKLHSFNYETWIVENLDIEDLPTEAYLARLRNIKRQLKDGTHPGKILEKKDVKWDGK